MTFFWLCFFYSSLVFILFSFIYFIYDKIKKRDSLKSVFFFLSFPLFFFADNRLCHSIADEICSDLKHNRLKLEKNNFITTSDFLTLTVSSQKYHFEGKTYGVTVLPSGDDLIFKKDRITGKYWVFYTKYHLSTKRAVGYIESK